MATVANLMVSLGLSTAAFSSGRKRANKELQALASSVKSIQGMIAGGLAAVGAAATIGAAKAFVSSQMDIIDATGKTADRLGISTESLIAYRHAAGLAGVGNDEFDATLEKMTRNIGLAAQSAGAQRDAIEALGLSAEDLARMKPDQALAVIADRFKEIKNPAERAALVTDIFGRSGVKLQNTLFGGSEALRAAREEADKLGISYSRVDAAKVEQANDAWARAKAVVTGVGQQVAIGLSPYLTAATNQFLEIATAGGGIGPKVGGAIEWVATGIAHVVDYLNLGKAAFHTLRGVGLATMTKFAWAIDMVGQGFVDLLNVLPGVEVQWTSAMKMMAKNLEEETQRVFDQAGDAYNDFAEGKASAGVKALFAQIKADAQTAGEAVAAAAAAPIIEIDHEAQNAAKRVTDVLAGLQKDLQTFGMDSGQRKLFDLEAMGASPQELAQARQLVSQLKQLEEAQQRQQDMASQAKSIYESTRTPLEIYESQITRLGELLAAGAIDWDTYGRAVRKAREDLEGVAGMGRSATLSERAALMSPGGRKGSQPAMSAGGLRAAGGTSGGGGKIKVDGTDKTNKLLQSIDSKLDRSMVTVLA